MSLDRRIEFTVNGLPTRATIPVRMSTLAMVRDVLKLTGTKYGCGEGECGACTVLVDGIAVNSCLMFAVDCDGRELTTIEGLQTREGLSVLQQEFVNNGAVQCGFCIPGMVMQGTYLLQQHRNMTMEDIRRGLEGNLCRCTGYRKIIAAVVCALQHAQPCETVKP